MCTGKVLPIKVGSQVMLLCTKKAKYLSFRLWLGSSANLEPFSSISSQGSQFFLSTRRRQRSGKSSNNPCGTCHSPYKNTNTKTQHFSASFNRIHFEFICILSSHFPPSWSIIRIQIWSTLTWLYGLFFMHFKAVQVAQNCSKSGTTPLRMNLKQMSGMSRTHGSCWSRLVRRKMSPSL